MNNRIGQPGFRPRNTLNDKPESSQKSTTQEDTLESLSDRSEFSLPCFLPQNSTPPPQPNYWERQQYSSDRIGDSSSLFSFDSPASFDFSQIDGGKSTFVFGGSQNNNHKSAAHESIILQSNMVNERAPAKPSQPIVINESPLPTDESNTSKRRQPVPRTEGHVFGQASPMKPSAAIRRPTADPFYRPKQRVEHHRPNHPHMNAAKEGIKKVIHKFQEPAAPAAYESPRFRYIINDPERDKNH